MTIAEIKNCPVGNWYEFTGTITKIGEIKQRIGSDQSNRPGQPYIVQKLTVTDNTSSIGMWAEVTQVFVMSTRVKGSGLLSEYLGKAFMSYAKVEPASPMVGAAYTAPPQALPTTPTTTLPGPESLRQPPTGAMNDMERDAKTTARCAIMTAKDLVVAGKIELESMYIVTDEIQRYLRTGNHPLMETKDGSIDPAPVEDVDVPPADDDIPF
ncbi:MAG: hypothetical protein AMJ75_00210 [Phycisphaerae bacterium SM1_79]|nr:MAG: hypothetical protein AMJ75_00210 [Phycisphaerae bacterium SM1_79]